ncbi:MAG: HPr(Ser) kinase/phosphatase [Gammaproteobacteria bacterium]|nr:HPr(Ser) kinase/phosphatase [Gammaproteobacteria bacterium]
MTTQITVKELFDSHSEKYSLQWISGQEGGKNLILPEETKDNQTATSKSKSKKKRSSKGKTAETKSLVGFLNLIHPHQVQIFGGTELKYFEGLRSISKQDAIRQLFTPNPACIIVSNSKTVPAFLKRKCNEYSVPLFSSPLTSNKLTDSLRYYLNNLFADVLTLHGVYMEVHAIGVLITGPSSVGKSELALELITRGHRLVADDAPQFSRIAPDIINGTCPAALQDFLEVRGLGIINVRELFGDSAIKINKYLRLIIRLEPLSRESIKQIDRLEGSYTTQNLLDLEIPEITLPVAPGRNLAVLLECAARNHMLRFSGYNASKVFTGRQQTMIAKDKK